MRFIFAFLTLALVCLPGVGVRGTAAAVGGPLPPPALASSDGPMPDVTSWPLFSWLLFGLIGLFLLVGSIAGAILVISKLIESIRGRKEKPVQLDQPITIEHVDQVVRVGRFNERVGPLEARLQKIERTVDDVLVNPEGYLHKSIHSVRNALQQVVDGAREREDRLTDLITAAGKETSARVAKVHERADQLVESVGELRGEMKHITGAVERLQAKKGAA